MKRDFIEAVREFEVGYFWNQCYPWYDYSDECQNLGIAIAMAIMKKLVDPSAKAAPMRDYVSKSGCNQTMVKLRRQIMEDATLLENTRNFASKATKMTYNSNGDSVTVTKDKHSLESLNKVIKESLGDGVDLVQESICWALKEGKEYLTTYEVDMVKDNGLDMAYCLYSEMDDDGSLEYIRIWNMLDADEPIKSKEELYTYSEKMDMYGVNPVAFLRNPVKVDVLTKKVYIRRYDSAKWKEEELKPVQLVFRCVREYIRNMEHVKAEVANMYSYIQKEVDGSVDNYIYVRYGKFADLGGYTAKSFGNNWESHVDYTGSYTVGEDTVEWMERKIEELSFSRTQNRILEFRLKGNGYKSIASYMGLKQGTVTNQVYRMRKKSIEKGFYPGYNKE